jgi:hypothetical protein
MDLRRSAQTPGPSGTRGFRSRYALGDPLPEARTISDSTSVCPEPRGHGRGDWICSSAVVGDLSDGQQLGTSTYQNVIGSLSGPNPRSAWVLRGSGQIVQTNIRRMLVKDHDAPYHSLAGPSGFGLEGRTIPGSKRPRVASNQRVAMCEEIGLRLIELPVS